MNYKELKELIKGDLSKLSPPIESTVLKGFYSMHLLKLHFGFGYAAI